MGCYSAYASSVQGEVCKMVNNYPRLLAGAFAGAGALILIYQGHTTEGGIILSTMVGFFVGEKNGSKASKAS